MGRFAGFLFLIVVVTLPLAGLQAREAELADLLAGDERFSTFLRLAATGGMLDVLAGAGPMILLAPVNEAFAELPDFVLTWLARRPAVLQDLLHLHVLPGALADGKVEAVLDTHGAGVIVADVNAHNGRLRPIDRVLLPAQELEVVVPAFVEGSIISAGSSTVFLLSEVIAARFRREGYRGGNVSVYSIGTGAGFERFCTEGITDIANASRPITDSERQKCQAIGRQVFALHAGTDLLVVVVNSANDFADNLSLAQLARLFSTADTWQDVNPAWPDRPVERFIPGTDSGSLDLFVEHLFSRDRAPILGASRTSVSGDVNVLAHGVAGNLYGVGFLGYAAFNANRHRLKAVPLEGVAPHGSKVFDGSYPLARSLMLYSAPDIIAARPQVGEFLSYYLTVVNQEIEKAGYFPADPQTLNRSRLLLRAAIGH